jgi:CubicO group peptidase (beta-lactamase class C family)
MIEGRGSTTETSTPILAWLDVQRAVRAPTLLGRRRKETGLAGLPGSAGEYYWAGAAGTGFWVDPKEGLICIFMTQAAPGEPRRYDRQLFKQLVYQAIND